MTFKQLLCCAGALASPLAPAQAAKIDLVDLGGVTGSAAETGFRIAADYWESILTNDVTITIGVKYGELRNNAIATTNGTDMDYAVVDWMAAVTATKSGSQLDQTVVLPTVNDVGGVGFVANDSSETATNDTSVLTYVDGDRLGSQMLWSSTAIVKAVGGTAIYAGSNTYQVDGEVAFSPDKDYDFDPSDGIEEYTYDFIGTAIHEMGHVLGFSSGVDSIDYVGDPAGPSEWPYGLNDAAIYTPLDMFRYSKDPLEIAPGDDPVLDVSVGGDPYFSIDGGATVLYDGYFSTGRYNGDGEQASHWGDVRDCGNEVGAMNPTICDGQMMELTALDLSAFDAIGWNVAVDTLADPNYRITSADIYRQFAATIPEPSSWALMLLGFALVGRALRNGRPTLGAAVSH